MLRATTACTFSTSQLPKVVRSWCVLYILTWKCASRHNGVQLFISHLPDVSAPAALASLLFNPPDPQNHEKHSVRDFPTFSRTCMFFLLIFSLLTLLPADCFFMSPYCRKFGFQTSFDHRLFVQSPSVVSPGCRSNPRPSLIESLLLVKSHVW